MYQTILSAIFRKNRPNGAIYREPYQIVKTIASTRRTFSAKVFTAVFGTKKKKKRKLELSSRNLEKKKKNVKYLEKKK
jgi:hypothetical protein